MSVHMSLRKLFSSVSMSTVAIIASFALASPAFAYDNYFSTNDGDPGGACTGPSTATSSKSATSRLTDTPSKPSWPRIREAIPCMSSKSAGTETAHSATLAMAACTTWSKRRHTSLIYVWLTAVVSAATPAIIGYGDIKPDPTLGGGLSPP